MQSAIEGLRPAAEAARAVGGRKKFIEFVTTQSTSIARTLLKYADGEFEDLGVSSEEASAYFAADERLDECPSVRLFRQILIKYIDENAGLVVASRAPQPSDGGDMMHSLYVAHTDFWRGDTYFTSLVGRATTTGKTTIVPKLVDLPMFIRARVGN